MEHNRGKVFSTQYRMPLELIYYEACLNEQDARAREKYLKSGMGKRYLKNRLKRCFPKDEKKIQDCEANMSYYQKNYYLKRPVKSFQDLEVYQNYWR